MRGYILDFVFALFVAVIMVGACVAVTRIARADGSGSAISDGSGSGSGSAAAPAPTDKPSDKLHNPVDDPLASLDDVRKAKSGGGWSLAVLAALVCIFRGLAVVGTKYEIGWLAFLAKGRTADGLAILGTASAAAFDALAYGGNWFAVLAAALGAALLWLQSPKPKAVTP